MESVRSTSGRFAYIQGSKLSMIDAAVHQVVLLPSDCVRFRDSTGNMVLGRVKCISIDLRDTSTPNTLQRAQPRECALINRLVAPKQLSGKLFHEWLEQSQRLSEPVSDSYPLDKSDLSELVLMETREIVLCPAIISRI